MSEQEKIFQEMHIEEETVPSTPKKIINIPNVLPNWVDERLKMPIIFSMIVICQGLFGGYGLKQVPERVVKLSNNPIARFVFVTAIAYTATSDMETALFSVVMFFGIMYLIRTPAERALVPHFV
ncbi:hypothetical protein CPAV1605_723 [seawater metagenome]|uniref:Uncharacterized protein n=1 Tax=seawater metagenome TaxID=1561972 RepID=A0A5E8CI23_9ZZZZ